MTILLLIIGLVLLVAGAEALVRGASGIAFAMKVPHLIIGLTVVAYGTSTPELAVSVFSGLSGQPDIALGNVVGSNIFNVLLILGLSSMIVPLVVSSQLVRFDVPVMIAVSILTFVMGMDGKLGRLDGGILFTGAVAYTLILIRMGRKEGNLDSDDPGDQEKTKADTAAARWIINILLVLGGLGLLVAGSRLLINSSIVIARHLGVSELVIGLTLVAAGTSLPELATSVVAGIRGQRDIAVGNVVGSNIFNILAVLGLSSLISPTGVTISTTAMRFDIPFMIAVAVACLPIFFTGYIIARWEGLLFVLYYGAYTLYLFLAEANRSALNTFDQAMIYYIFPLTAVTLTVLAWRELKRP
ncbi:MAG: calcium/sodium antiporter [Thermodesulfobacteriota bacterium]